MPSTTNIWPEPRQVGSDLRNQDSSQLFRDVSEVWTIATDAERYATDGGTCPRAVHDALLTAAIAHETIARLERQIAASTELAVPVPPQALHDLR